MNRTNNVNQAIAELRQAGAIDPLWSGQRSGWKPIAAASTNLSH